MRKVRGLCGDWSDSFFSCEVDSLDAYLAQHRHVPTDPSILTDSRELWRINPKPDDALQVGGCFTMACLGVYCISASTKYYNFSFFAMTLNQLTPDLERVLPPTDSRFRPDVRQLELGNFGRHVDPRPPSSCRDYVSVLELASTEKSRLEEKQREAARHRDEAYAGKWFHLKKHPFLDMQIWTSNDKYWLRDYADSESLF